MHENATREIKILIVDDQHAVVLLLKLNFEKAGCVVYIASDGEEGLEQALTHKPDLVITDIVMPRMDGYTLCRELSLREETKDIPIVLITGLSQHIDEEKIRPFPVRDFITKPFSPKGITKRVLRILDQG